MSESPPRRMHVPPHVVVRDFPAETVLLNIRTGQYHGLDPVAGRMLKAATDSSTVEGAVDLLATQFDDADPQRLHDDFLRFCDAMLDRGLLESD